MFCAIATTIERCKTEGVVDVFLMVKALRVQKPGAVRTVVSLASQNAVYSVSVLYVIIVSVSIPHLSPSGPVLCHF